MSTPAERPVTPLSSIREVKAGSFFFERPLALPPAFCDSVIERFEAHPEQQHEGRIGQIRTKDRGVKVTTDLDVSVRPQRGNLVMFPPFWTHEHQAAEVKEGVKHIATTWVVFA